MELVADAFRAQQAERRLNQFERYLTIWVGLCMVLGVWFGQIAPQSVEWLRGME